MWWVDNPQAKCFHFAEQGDAASLEILLASNRNLAIIRDEDDDTPLHKAASNGHSKCVQLLLSCGASPNSPGCSSRTPLHCACFEGHAQVTGDLLFGGATINVLDALNETPLHKAAARGALDVLQLLLTTDEARQLVNSKNVLGSTPLHCACHDAHIDCVTALLSAGANLHASDDFGYRPIHVAMNRRNVNPSRFQQLLELLHKAGAQP